MQFEKRLSFDTNPLYALLHESIYCQVNVLVSFLCMIYGFLNHWSSFSLQGSASRWSANRIRTEVENKFDAVKAAREGLPVLFTGEVGCKEYHFSIPCRKHIYFLQKYYFNAIQSGISVHSTNMACFDSTTYPSSRKLRPRHYAIITK